MAELHHKTWDDGTDTLAIYSEALEMCSEPNYQVMQMYLDRQNRRAKIRRIAEITAAWAVLLAFCCLFWYGVARGF